MNFLLDSKDSRVSEQSITDQFKSKLKAPGKKEERINAKNIIQSNIEKSLNLSYQSIDFEDKNDRENELYSKVLTDKTIKKQIQTKMRQESDDYSDKKNQNNFDQNVKKNGIQIINTNTRKSNDTYERSNQEDIKIENGLQKDFYNQEKKNIQLVSISSKERSDQ